MIIVSEIKARLTRIQCDIKQCLTLTCSVESHKLSRVGHASGLFLLCSALTQLGDTKGIRPVKKTGCWFVSGGDLTEALLVL